ncbi:MAG: MarR family transcriptional regulator [Candidatus Aenigmarchaeota archaeon]|nr:MarR family transcriptional regulator [Candidatus Aenigmarchaeota archaeon]
MGRILSLLFILSLVSIAGAVQINEMNIVAQIREEYVHMSVEIKYNLTVGRTDYFVLAPVTDVHVYDENNSELVCKLKERDIGTLILCEGVSLKKVRFEFNAYELVKKQGKINHFSYPFSIRDPTEEFSLVVKLPIGAMIVEQEKLNQSGMKPYSPEDATRGSDGRCIYLSWHKLKPRLGTTFDVSIFFERVELPKSPTTLLVAIVFLLLAVIFFLSRKKSYDVILPVLTKEERDVVSLLLASGKKQMDQREIVRKIDMSKSKVSRIIKNLEQRGIVKRIRLGRTNKVKLLERVTRKNE